MTYHITHHDLPYNTSWPTRPHYCFISNVTNRYIASQTKVLFMISAQISLFVQYRYGCGVTHDVSELGIVQKLKHSRDSPRHDVWGFPSNRPVQLPTTGRRRAQAVWKKYVFAVNIEHCHFGRWNIDLWVIWQMYQLQNLRRVDDVSRLMIFKSEGLHCKVMFLLINLITASVV